jgi:hypothetical protein
MHDDATHDRHAAAHDEMHDATHDAVMHDAMGLLGGISCATAQVHGEIHVKECTCA